MFPVQLQIPYIDIATCGNNRLFYRTSLARVENVGIGERRWTRPCPIDGRNTGAYFPVEDTRGRRHVKIKRSISGSLSVAIVQPLK